MSAVLVLLAGVFLLPLVREALRSPVSRMRGQTGLIALARLPQGATRYRWFGPEGGPVIVAVHGLTSPSEVFDPLALTLAQHGFRVLSYDLYGRGLSDDPAEPQTAGHFLRQLEGLLDDQKVTGRTILVGYSMGGQIASLLAAAHPDRVSALVLLAPAGMGLAVTRFWRLARDAGPFGSGLVLAFGDLALARGMAPSGPLRNSQLRQLQRRGYLAAVLSSMRGVIAMSLEETQREIGRRACPTLAIWAGRDAVIPAAAMGRLALWNRAAEQEVLQDADHSLPATHPEQIARLIIDFHGRRVL